MSDQHSPARRHQGAPSRASTSVEEMFKSAKGQRERDAVDLELERELELKARYGRWLATNRRAPRTFWFVLWAVTVVASTIMMAHHYHTASVLGLCPAWGFVVGMILGGWPKIKTPPPAPADRSSRTAGSMIGYMLAHHMIRHAFRHRPRRSLGR